MTKVMLIGGAGFIGAFLAKNLLEQEKEVIIYDNYINFVDPLKSNYQDSLRFRLKMTEQATFVRGDIRHKGHLLRTLKEHKPDKVVLLSAVPIATLSNKLSEDSIDINMIGTINVLEALRECPFVKRFVYTSSSMVYGDFQKDSADETHPTNPKGIYGGTKLAGEILTKVYANQLGFDYVIIRPSAVYGPTDVNRRVSQIFVENALREKPLVLYNNGKTKLDFTYVEDCADGFMLALYKDAAANEIFNITCGNARSLHDFVDILGKYAKFTIEYKEEPESEKRPKRGTLDISKARQLLGYNPNTQLEEGIPKYITFVKEHLK